MASHGFWFMGAENPAGDGSQSPNTRKWRGVKRNPEIVFLFISGYETKKCDIYCVLNAQGYFKP